MKTHFNFSKAIHEHIKVFLDGHCNVAKAPTSPKQWQMQWILPRNQRELISPRLRRAQRVRRIMNANLFRRGFGVHGAESIQRVQRRNFVALRKCWIVEDGVHKIIQTAA